jgi:SAM-dependent methyltransferase
MTRSEVPWPWDAHYGQAEWRYGTDPNAFLTEWAPSLRAGGRVLCVAEGQGRNAVYLAELGHDVVAVDRSSVGLADAHRLAASRGVTIHTEVADLATYDPGEDEWDAIVSIFAHLPSTVRRALHRRLVPALRPGGLFILEAYTPRQLGYGTGGPADVDMMMPLADLVAELQGLEILVGQEKERVVVEGSRHTGLAHVVQVVARNPERG